MAGIGFLGTTLTFNSVAVTHLTSFNINTQGSSISQVVADSSDALTLAQSPVKSVTFSFAVPSATPATLLEALDADETGSLVIVLKDGVGGSTLGTWTSADSNCESEGCSVSSSGGAFTIGTCTITTNGGTWTNPA